MLQKKNKICRSAVGVRDEMKCRFCGGIVNLTDSVCPHCGKENPLGKNIMLI